MDCMERPRRLLTHLYPWLGIAGTGLVSITVLATALLFSGKQGEAYSLLNHFISELGEPGVSRAALLFNAGLVASGALFIPCSLGLGLHIRSAWSLLGAASGVFTGAFLAGVGFFPMNNLPPHIFTAMWFFRCGLLTVLLFGIAFVAQRRSRPRVPKGAVVFSALAAAAYGAFLVSAALPSAGGAHALEAAFARRPAVWPLALLEWGVFFATILWFLGVPLVGLRSAVAFPGEDQRAARSVSRG